jgi:uncharacterized protein (TIGR00251 family)
MCKISILVIANASRTEVISFDGGILKVKISEPPNENRANGALMRFFRKELKIVGIRMLSGAHAKHKVIDFGEDFSSEEIVGRLLRK